MWQMLQQDEPGDYVIGTGESHSVRDFVEQAFAYARLDWHEYVKIDPKYMRPTEVDVLCADATKADQQLSWRPKITCNDLVRIMVDADLQMVGLEPIGEGKGILAAKCGKWHERSESLYRITRASEQAEAAR